MRFKVVIEASFTHEVEVEAQSREEAQDRASDALMDYLDVTLHNSQRFAYFHEYELKERVVSVTESEPVADVPEENASKSRPGRLDVDPVIVGCVLALLFCAFVFVLGIWTLLGLLK